MHWMHLFSEIPRVGQLVDHRGAGNPALTGPLALVMGRLKIHRPGGPLHGFVQQALKLARRPDV